MKQLCVQKFKIIDKNRTEHENTKHHKVTPHMSVEEKPPHLKTHFLCFK